MLIRKASDIRSSEITPKSLYLRRREFIQSTSGGALATVVSAMMPPALASLTAQGGLTKLANVQKSPLSTTEEKLTQYDAVTGYNNFYEFGTEKEDPARNAHTLNPKPWKLTIDGEVGKPGSYDLDDFIKPFTLEERVYRMRCVEGWSMVIPWVGIPFADIIKQVEPTSRAKFVQMETLVDTRQMPGQRYPVLDWPYVEGLRLDEATHPLTILAVGLYGEVLPNQNGAPIRLVVPWKYGFKGVKSIVVQDTYDYEPILRKLKPDYLVHGDDWKIGFQSRMREKILKLLNEWGGKLVEPKYTRGISSTALIDELTKNGVTLSVLVANC